MDKKAKQKANIREKKMLKKKSFFNNISYFNLCFVSNIKCLLLRIRGTDFHQ